MCIYVYIQKGTPWRGEFWIQRLKYQKHWLWYSAEESKLSIAYPVSCQKGTLWGAQFFNTQSFAMFAVCRLKWIWGISWMPCLWHRNTLSILLQWWTTYLSCLSLSNVCKANEEQCFIIFSISVFGLREMEAGREPGEPPIPFFFLPPLPPQASGALGLQI